MHALALDIGGTHIGCGLVQDDRLLAQTSLQTDSTSRFAEVLPRVVDALTMLLQQVGVSAVQCSGIAIGFPGIVDARSSMICSTLKKFEDVLRVDLKQWASRAFGLPLRIENDARMAMLGEHFAGAAKGCSDAVMMTLGTGVGSATILSGKILRGAHAHAGCLGGHFTAKYDGRLCHCGNLGCAEAEASGWALPLIAKAWPGFEQSALRGLEALDFRELFTHAEQGDQVAREVCERCLNVWAANAVSLIHAYDPEVVVLGGGVMQSAGQIIPFVQQYVNQHTWSTWGKAQVRGAALGNAAALLGAVPLLQENMQTLR